MPDVFHVRGETITLYGRFYDSSGAPANPTTVICTVLLPDGTIENPPVDNITTGVYSVVYPTASKPVGRYSFQFVGSGTIQSSTPVDYFEIQAELSAQAECASNKTPASSQSTYCTPTEFLLHVDSTFAGQLVDDSGLELTGAQLTRDGVLEEVLRRASGIVESHCFRGKRYTACDLKRLLDAGGNAAAYLRGLVADVAVGLLRDRRVFDDTRPLPSVQRAEEILVLLSKGEAILPFEETAEAGLPDSEYFSRADIDRTRMITGDLRFWGNRSRDLRGIY